jgi:hypothetical protein
VIGENGLLEFSVFSFEPMILRHSDQAESFSTQQPEHIQMPHIRSIVTQLQGRGICPSTGKTAAVTSRVMDVITGILPSYA